MKLTQFLTSLVLTIILVLTLNNPMGKLPPIGPFMSPYSGFWQNAEPINFKFDKAEHLSGLKTAATVQFDERLVPHIYTQNEHDLYYLQGYVTAYFRLWQMETQVRATSGRLAEILGPDLIERDKEMRRKGLVKAAKEAVKEFTRDSKTRNILEAYTDGVNAYIEQLSYQEYPVEYKLLDYKPEKWSILKSALIMKMMANDLVGRERDLEHSNAYKTFGPEAFNLLYPDFLDGQDPIVPGEIVKKSKLDSIADTNDLGHLSDFVNFRESIKHPPPIGSNNWAVSGAKTASQYPILCNDPHLRMSLPSIWFEIHLVTPELNVYGVSIPGGPAVIIGFNEDIAWGVTNASRDVKDWYMIDFKNKKKEQYRNGNKWLNSYKVIEEIKVKNQASVYDTVYYTHLGPVVYEDPKHPKHHLALRWKLHDTSDDIMTFYNLNYADNYEDYYRSLNYYECPGQNFAFASKEGDIAIWQQGKFPIKWKGQGKFILDGSNPEHAWQAYIPREDNPHMINPERGFVSSANQHPTDANYPYYYNGNFETYRNRRLNQQLYQLNNIELNDMKKLQVDNYNLQAAESLPYMLSQIQYNTLNKEEQKYLAKIKEWDFYNEVNSTEATIYEIWWTNLYDMLWDEMDNKEVPLAYPTNFVSIDWLKKYPDHPLMDFKETSNKEDAKALINLAFQKAVKDLQTWRSENQTDDFRWSKYKGTTIEHLAKIPAFSANNIPIGGNKGILNATSKYHGASWRMIVELGPNGPNAHAIYPGGQSGNPGSQFYDNFIGEWADGLYYPVLFNKKPIFNEQGILQTLNCKPE